MSVLWLMRVGQVSSMKVSSYFKILIVADIIPIVGSLTFHQLSMIISGAAAIFSCLIALFLTIRQATHFSNPIEQKQILRIFTIIPTFSFISFLCVWLNEGSAALYIVGALDVAKAFPMAAFFLLMSA